jgi:DNA-binding transcriptional LysR family regulator
VDLRQLDHFVAVAEEQNFTRAAQRVHIVQSALSTSIRGLEEELGTSLFRRGSRKVTLTPAGEVMLDRARRVLKTCATCARRWPASMAWWPALWPSAPGSSNASTPIST